MNSVRICINEIVANYVTYSCIHIPPPPPPASPHKLNLTVLVWRSRRVCGGGRAYSVASQATNFLFLGGVKYGVGVKV